jgi:hypothetical protein
MYTIKILQRLIDCGTHNSIFAFVLLILKNHFQRASLPAENQSAIPSFSKSPGPAPRLPPRPSARPRLATRPTLQSERKTSRNQTIKEHGARTVRTHFFSTDSPLFPRPLCADFRPTRATPDSRGALIKPQTALRRKQLFRKTPNFFHRLGPFSKKPPAAHSAAQALGKPSGDKYAASGH